MEATYGWFDWEDNTPTVNNMNVIKEARKPWYKYAVGENVLAKLPQFPGTWADLLKSTVAEDYGGPRREFFSRLLPQLKEKYFSPIKDFLASDYETVGKIFALSMLQNGRLPRIMDAELVQQMFELNEEEVRDAVWYLRKGMNSLGLIEIMEAHRSLIHLITPKELSPVMLKMVTHLLTPVFSETGSNKRAVEAAVYRKFINYLREVAAGRRDGVTLGKVLLFATACEEEPPLGFKVQPSLRFAERLSFIPTANTCSNTVYLTVHQERDDLPADDVLFGFFDYAFCNAYFGLP